MPWALLLASGAVWLLAPLAGALSVGLHNWETLFPAERSYSAIAMGLLLTSAYALTFRRKWPRLRTALLLILASVAAASILYDLFCFVSRDNEPTGRMFGPIGALPAVSILLLTLQAVVLRRGAEGTDQLVLSLVSTVFCLAVAEVVVAFAMRFAGIVHAPLGGSIPVAVALTLIAAAGLSWRRRTCPGGIFSGDEPAWRAVRVGIPLAILVPIDRFGLAAYRSHLHPITFAQLDLIVTIVNVLVVALLFNWAIWKLAREYREVRRKEARLALAIEAPGAGMFDWNVRSGALMWTPEAERRIGFAPGTLRRIEQWEARVLPEDLAALHAAEAEATARRADHYTFRFRLRTVSGQLRTFEGTARCFYDGEGILTRVVGMNLDVTERDEREAALEESEAQLRSIFENVPDAMVVIDEGGRIRSFSHAAERMFGYPAGDVLEADMAMLLPEELADLRHRLTARYMETGEPQVVGRALTLLAQRANGAVFPVELTVGETATRNGRVYIAFVRDISERVEAQRHLDAVRDEYAHSARLNAMGEMAAGLAHELNQPLAASANFLGAAEMIVDADHDDPELRAMLQSARSQLLRAGDIIRRLRDFLAKGSADTRVEPVEQTVRDAIALGLLANRQDHIEVDLELQPGAERMLADRVQVQQVLVNLLRNSAEAVRTLPRERRSIRISAEPVDGEQIRISVADSGPGLPAEVLGQLFTPFLTTKGEHGLGIGLSICRRIVEAHGGEMVAGNHPEGGACIAFTLPRPHAVQLTGGTA